MQRTKKSQIRHNLQNRPVLTRLLLILLLFICPLFPVFTFLSSFWMHGYDVAVIDTKNEINGIKNTFLKIVATIFLPWEDA